MILATPFDWPVPSVQGNKSHGYFYCSEQGDKHYGPFFVRRVATGDEYLAFIRDRYQRENLPDEITLVQDPSTRFYEISLD